MKPKKLLSIFLAAVILIAALPFGIFNVSAATSGTTGDCTWTLDRTVLTISGNGAMKDYDKAMSYPWGVGNYRSYSRKRCYEYR